MQNVVIQKLHVTVVSPFVFGASIFLRNISIGLNRTIMALWKNRKLTPEQRLELVDDAEKKYPENEKHSDDTDTFTGMEEASMSHICSFDIPLTVGSFLFPNFNCFQINSVLYIISRHAH